MIITSIVPITKSRYRITLEDGSEFVLYKGEIRKWQLREGDELSGQARQDIMEEILPKRARLRSMNLLKNRDYTKKQLTDKLRQGGYPEEAIMQALSYVESYGYINDERYARSYIEYHMQDRSRVRIEQDLYKKGIDKALIGRCFDKLLEEGESIDEFALIRKLLQKKDYQPEEASYEERQKMYAFLYRKGFRQDVISKALLLDIT